MIFEDVTAAQEDDGAQQCTDKNAVCIYEKKS